MSLGLVSRIVGELTSMEWRVFALASEGLSKEEIGNLLGTSHRTIGAHLQNVYKVTGMASRKELAGFVFANPDLLEMLRRHTDIYMFCLKNTEKTPRKAVLNQEDKSSMVEPELAD